jgi:hypothetical protein
MIRQFALPAAFALITLAAGSLPAQRQPDEASNAQDERVNLNLAPSADGRYEGSLLIIRTDDTNADVDYNARIYELGVEGWEILPFLNRIVEQEGGSVDFWTHTDPETGEERHYVQAVTAAYQFEDIDELVRAFDRPGATSHRGGVRRHLRVRHRLASDVAAILRGGVISPEGFVQADDATNTLFVRDSHSDGMRALEVLRFYDVPQRMVEMDIRMIEVDLSDHDRLGLDWEAWKNAVGGFIQVSAAQRSGLPADFASFDLLLNLDARVLADFLNYLVRRGSATIVTHSTLTAVNGEVAVLESRRRVPRVRPVAAPGVFHLVEAGGGDSPELLVEEGALRSTLTDDGSDAEGLSLRIFPRIGAETMIAEISAVMTSAISENLLGEPVVAESRINSIVRLHHDEPILVGTFDRQRESRVESGVPLLRSIPVLGPRLFQTTHVRNGRYRLILIMTPRMDDHLRFTEEQIEYGRRWVETEPPAFVERSPRPIEPDFVKPGDVADPADRW